MHFYYGGITMETEIHPYKHESVAELQQSIDYLLEHGPEYPTQLMPRDMTHPPGNRELHPTSMLREALSLGASAKSLDSLRILEAAASRIYNISTTPEDLRLFQVRYKFDDLELQQVTAILAKYENRRSRAITDHSARTVRLPSQGISY